MQFTTRLEYSRIDTCFSEAIQPFSKVRTDCMKSASSFCIWLRRKASEARKLSQPTQHRSVRSPRPFSSACIFWPFFFFSKGSVGPGTGENDPCPDQLITVGLPSRL